MIELKNCPLCGQDALSAFEPYLKKEGYSIVRCRCCSLILLNPQDDPATVLDYYSEDVKSPADYFESASNVNRVVFDDRLDWLEKRVPVGRLLDVGSSVGTFLEAAADRGWDTVGLEANRKAVQFCEKKGMNVVCGFFNPFTVSTMEPASFDLVCFNDSLEHFSDPAEALRLALRLIRPSGYILINTPNIGSLMARTFQFKPKEHIFYFDWRTLAMLLAQNGWVVECVEETGRGRDFGALETGATVNGPLWISIFRLIRIARLEGVANFMLKTFFKDELLALARKG